MCFHGFIHGQWPTPQDLDTFSRRRKMLLYQFTGYKSLGACPALRWLVQHIVHLSSHTCTANCNLFQNRHMMCTWCFIWWHKDTFDLISGLSPGGPTGICSVTWSNDFPVICAFITGVWSPVLYNAFHYLSRTCLCNIHVQNLLMIWNNMICYSSKTGVVKCSAPWIEERGLAGW